MTEEVQKESQEEQIENQEIEYSDVEKQALEKGWKPKEEYQGDPDKWRSAEVFVALEEPLKRIEHQSKELKAVRSALEAFKEHHTKVKETEYNRALKSLQEARREAMRDGDTERALVLEEKVEEIKAEKEAVVAEGRQPIPEVREGTYHPEFKEWLNHNGWYETSKAMRAVADRLGLEYQAEGLSPREVLKRVEEDVRKEFPHKFGNDKKARSMAVEPPSRNNRTSKEDFALDDNEREIMRKIVRSGVMTEKEYIAELKRVKQGA